MALVSGCFKYSVLFGHHLEIVLKIYYSLVTIYRKVKDVETYDVYTIFFFQQHQV
jgi:hypothetical protein